ncbi:TPA: hypothetical protein ACPJZ5_004751 [Vibrio diabolicus]
MKKTANKAFKSDSQRLAVSLRSSIAKRCSHLNAALALRRVRMFLFKINDSKMSYSFKASVLSACIAFGFACFYHFLVGNPEWFSSNYVQMKAKSDKNHGKVFDTSSGYIRIWEPIRSAVDEYGRKVFNTGI